MKESKENNEFKQNSGSLDISRKKFTFARWFSHFLPKFAGDRNARNRGITVLILVPRPPQHIHLQISYKEIYFIRYYAVFES